MKHKRQTGSDVRVLTAKTGEDFYDSEASVASDAGISSDVGPTTAPIVGRTAYDLLSEKGVTRSVANLIAGIDAVEALGALAYILLDLLGKSGGLVMRFWVFLALLAGYHVVAKPLEILLWSAVKRERPKPSR